MSAVLLDVGGVLLLPSPEVMLPPLRAAEVRPDLAVLERAHYHATAAVERVPPAGRWRRYLTAYATACGVPAQDAGPVAAELARFADGSTWRHVIPGSADALRAIAALGMPIAIVSNSTGVVERDLRSLGVCQTGAGDGIEVAAVVDSAVVGVEKPDPRIFAVALDLLGTAPGGVVHVGDTVRFDVDGARAAGIRPIHLDPYGDCPSPDGHEHIRKLADVPPMLS